MRRVFTILALALTIGSLVAGCQSPAAPPTTAAKTTNATTAPTAPTVSTNTSTIQTPVPPVKIGVVESVTGAYASYGVPLMAAAKQVFQMVNDAGGIKSLGGAKIQMVQGISDSTPTTATNEVTRLITSENVVAMMGPTSTSDLLPSLPLFERYKIPAISSMNDETQYQKGYRYIFGVNPAGSANGKLQAQFIDYMSKKHGLPATSIAVATSSPGQTAVTDALIPALAELGYKNIVANETFPGATTDQAALALKFKAANPSLVVYNGLVQDAISYLKTSDTYGFTPWTINTSMALTAAVRDGLGAAAKKILTRPNLFGAGTVTYSTVYNKVTSLKTFQDAFQAANPGNTYDKAIVAMGGQQAYVLVRAIENAASRNSEDIAAALRKIDIKAPDPYLVLSDVYPELKMSDSGLVATGSGIVVQWADDLQILQAIYPDALATNAPRTQK